MSDPLKIYQAIAAREKASRYEAERLLEEKSRELYDKNCELARSAEQLSDALALLSEMMTVAPNGILLCCEDLLITNANANSARLLGCSTDDIAGRRLTDFMPAIEVTLDRVREGEFSIRQCEARTAAGQSLQIEIHGYAGKIRDRRRFMLIFYDITDRLEAERRQKQIDQQVQEARRLEAIGTLSAGIAHEINTPIQFIGDNLDFLLEALPQIREHYGHCDALIKATAHAGAFSAERAEIEAFADRIDLEGLQGELTTALHESRDGIRQVRDIVLLMKDFSHPGGGARESCNLNDLVRNVVTLSKGRQKSVVAVEVRACEDLPDLLCLRGSLQQVILNIVLNALDAVEDLEPPQRRVMVSTCHDEDRIALAISDTGPGVPEDLREKIFDPFFTTKPVGKGTGQGLALAKDCIVKGHGGRLRLVDLPGFTTTFLIELPRRGAGATENQEDQDAHSLEAHSAG